ncbi:MAG: acyl-CoA dehydrogenase C-terminal domain-containing protein [Spirosomataceae bacterium]
MSSAIRRNAAKSPTSDSTPVGTFPKNTEIFLADATLYLEFLGITTIAWQWLKQATQAQKALKNSKDEENFYQGKVTTARYFFEYELVKTLALSKRLLSSHAISIEMQTAWF